MHVGRGNRGGAERCPIGGSEIQLSEYIRFYRDGDHGFVESLLTERALLLDPLLEAVVQALERAPSSEEALVEALSGAGGAAVEVQARLDMLRDLGLMVASIDADREALSHALAQPLAAPLIDQVEVTNACPLTCAMCTCRRAEMSRPVGFLDVGLFRDLVAQIATSQAGAKPVTLHHAGESLLHRELEILVGIAAAAGLAPEVSVNPGFLPLARYRSLQEAGLARLVISLDGVTASTLEAVRGASARGEVALANLAAILDHRRAHQSRRPELILQMLRLAANQHEHDLFLERYGRMEALGVTALLKPLDATTAPAHFVVGEAGRQNLCRAPWRTLVVLWDGRVVPCCYDGQAQEVLGDLRRRSLLDIWRGEPLERLRQRLASGRHPEGSLCRDCPHRPDRFRRAPLRSMALEPLHW